MKILAVSDRVEEQLYSPDIRRAFSDVEMVFGCGDLPFYYLEYIATMLGVPVLYVRGNHDDRVYHLHGGRVVDRAEGCTDLHGRLLYQSGLLIAGVEGSMRYRPDGKCMYTDGEVALVLASLLPRLLFNWVRYGRFLDALVAHAPPYGIHDKDTNVHGGYKAFRWLIKTFQPAYFFHGHIHVYTEDQTVETVLGKTKVINTYGHRKGLIRSGQRHYIPRERPYIPSQGNTAEDFRDARRRAALESIWSSITSSSTDFDHSGIPTGNSAISFFCFLKQFMNDIFFSNN